MGGVYKPANSVQLHIAINDVPWLVQYLHDELGSSSKSLEAEQGELAADHLPAWFDMRDGAWQAKVRDMNGEMHRITRAVPRRSLDKRAFDVSEYQVKKQAIYEEVLAWIAETKARGEATMFAE